MMIIDATHQFSYALTFSHTRLTNVTYTFI